MPNFRLLGFLLIAVSAAAPPLRGSTAVQPQAADDDDLPTQQLYNIIDALIGSGDFGNWANIMSSTDPSMFPLSATLFVTEDSAFSSFSESSRSAGLEPSVVDPSLFFYHIVPQRLTFGDLMLFPVNSRLPTFLIDKSILIINNSRSNFTLDGSHLTRPDLFSTTTVSVHGIRDALDFAIHTEPDPSRNAPPVPHLPPPDKETSPLPPLRRIQKTRSAHTPHPQHLPSWMGLLPRHLDRMLQAAKFLSVLCSVLGLIKFLGYQSTSSTT